MKPLVHLLALTYLLSSVTGQRGTDRSSANGRWFLTLFDSFVRKSVTRNNRITWDYYKKINQQTEQAKVESDIEHTKLLKELVVEARNFHLPSMSSSVRRGLKKAIAMAGDSGLEDSKIRELAKIKTQMMSIRNARLHGGTRSINGYPHEYIAIWKDSRDRVGKRYRYLYPRYVELKNEAARLNGFNDYGHQWRAAYNQTDIIDEVHRLYTRIKPIYTILHTYVKYELKKMYPGHIFPKSGHIPAHLIPATWESLLDRIKPNEDVTGIDITTELINRNYTVKMMYDDANNFFKSLGFPGARPSVWENSRVARPKDVPAGQMICHPTVWDFHDKQDWRLSMCAQVNHYYMKSIYYEFGHLFYSQAYKDLPVYDMGSANEDNQINYLLSKALVKIPLLIEAMIIDLFRWGVFSGRITPENYNKEWWKLQCKYKGISPPTNRSKSDFDAGIYFHVAADVSFIRYFFSILLDYQLYRRACDIKGHQGPLHTCDISNSTQVGRRFRDLMASGTKRPWQDVLKEFTKSDSGVEASSMVEYYRPLYKYLINVNYPELKYWDDECEPNPSVE